MKVKLLASIALLCTAAAPSEPYFSPELFKLSYSCNWGSGAKKVAVLSEFESEWFSEHLRAADESSLYQDSRASRSSARETFRFTWLRTFHPPVVVRVEIDGQNGRLIGKQLSGAGGYDPGHLARKVERRLTAVEIERLYGLIAKTRPFEMGLPGCELGTDGAVWIIEGIDRMGYHFVKRWSPDGGPVREVGDYLISLTGWQYKEVY
jgi:hypothetical protein